MQNIKEIIRRVKKYLPDAELIEEPRGINNRYIVVSNRVCYGMGTAKSHAWRSAYNNIKAGLSNSQLKELK